MPSGTMPQVPLPAASAEEVAPETPGAAFAEAQAEAAGEVPGPEAPAPAVAEGQGQPTEMMDIRNVPTAPVDHQGPTGREPVAPYDFDQTGPEYPQPYRNRAGKSFAISAGLLAAGVLLLIITIWLATY